MRKITVLLVFLLLLCSCAQEGGTGTLKILLHSSVAKTITGGNSSMDITRYTVSGTGPGGKVFALDSTSSSVVIEGLRLGKWKISASGYNSSSKKVAFGEADVELSGSESVFTVNLDTLSGVGSLQLKFEWDSVVKNPVLELSLFDAFDEKLFSKTITPESGRTDYSLTITDISSGTYLVRCLLKNSDTDVGGTYEAFRITNGDKTSGTISFVKDEELPDEMQSLFVVTDTASPLTGHLEGITGAVASSENRTVSLVLDGYCPDPAKYSIRWFLDGKQVGNGEVLKNTENGTVIKPSNGTHILNAVVSGRELKTVGSVSWKFFSSPLARKGMAVFNSYENSSRNKGLLLRSDTIAGKLPNNRFVLVTPSENSLQLCSVYNDGLTVLKTYTSAMEGFGWLSNADGVFSCEAMNVFVVTDSISNANPLVYNSGDDSVSVVEYEGVKQRFEGGCRSPEISFSAVQTAFFVPSENGKGAVVICGTDGNTCLLLNCDAYSITGMGICLKPVCDSSFLTFAAKGSNALALSSQDNVLYLCSWGNFGFSSLWESVYCSVVSPKKILFLNSENMVLVGNSMLCKYAKYSSSGWTPVQVVQIEIKHVDVSQDGAYVYVVDSDNVMNVFSTLSGRLVKLGSVDTGLDVSRMILNSHDILCLSDDGNAAIFSIAEEDNL